MSGESCSISIRVIWPSGNPVTNREVTIEYNDYGLIPINGTLSDETDDDGWAYFEIEGGDTFTIESVLVDVGGISTQELISESFEAEDGETFSFTQN